MGDSSVETARGGPRRQPGTLIADDHAPTRSLLRASLESGGFLVVGEASDASSAVTLARSLRPDVALLDVRMPGGGISAAAAILSDRPETVVVMLTVSDDEEDLFAALRVGARGYILKGGDPSELPSELRRTLAGEAVLHGALLAKVLREFQVAERDRLFDRSRRARLTRREIEVLDLLERGATTAEVAAELFIAKVTVRSHIAAICRKLQLPDRAATLREVRSSGPP
ncbi:MAG TPA: response regulator transcription factor [Acidimicrobiales bacterium]|nr:response regulator transcription factor [Acidimicrobiales bacterium]